MTENFSYPNETSQQGIRKINVSKTELAQMRQGDQQTWSQIVDRLAPSLIRHASRYVGADGAEDVVSEAWASAYPQIMDPEVTVRDLVPYMFQTVGRKGIDELRRQDRRPFVPMDTTSSIGLSIFSSQQDSRTPEELVTTRLSAQNALRVVSGRADPGVAHVLYLESFGASKREIARIQGVPEGTVKSRSHRGRKVGRNAGSAIR